MATAPSSVVVRFVLYEKERDIDVQRESDQFQDIIFVQGGTTTDYRSIVYKTFAFIQVTCSQHSTVYAYAHTVCIPDWHTIASNGVEPKYGAVSHYMLLPPALLA